MNIGIYQAYWGRVGGGQRYVGVVAEVLAQQHWVEVVHHCPEFDPAAVAEPMELDLSRVRFRYVPPRERPAWSSVNPLRRLHSERDWGREISEGYDLFIDSSDNVPFFCHAHRGVLLTHFPLVSFEEFHGHTTETWRSRVWARRMAADIFHRLEWSRRFATYDLCLVNSEFTRRWMKRRWGLDSVVVYPPLRSGLKPLAKEPVILTIGAFHHAQHKKHEVTLEAFRDLCDRGLSGWRYVLVGACGAAAEDQASLARLRATAEGYPVEFRTNVSGDELNDLLGRARVLWHSMGYGVNPECEPGRLEHFGMVATEAMAAGCVPIVFDGGGLRESVTHGDNGLLWRTLDDLEAFTLAVAQDEVLRERLSAASRVRAKGFSRESFETRLLEALAPVLGSSNCEHLGYSCCNG
jgi:glycosyltransferase involved in cell wall biosynthesis